LKNPFPVYITYQTVFVDEWGQLQTRRDIYGLDKEITELLKGDPAIADVPVARSSYTDQAQIRSRKQPFNWDRGWDPYFSRGGTPGFYGQSDRNRFR
jgi:hypothetical protein